MKLLILSQYFWPEEFRINDLAEELLKRGHDVTVLTGKPNYPGGKIFKGYKFWGIKKENYKGVNIIRVPLIPRKDGKKINLILNYISYVFFSCCYVLFNRTKYDASLTFATSPITQVFAGILHRKLYGSRTYIWVQDLWPESVVAVGEIKKGTAYNILNSMVKWIYKRCDKILVQSEGFYDSIIDKGVSPNVIEYIPNWAEDLYSSSALPDTKKYSEIIPKGFIVMFAGNIGEAQDFDSIISAAILVKERNRNIKWVIIGDGRKRKEIEEKINIYSLEDVFFLLGRYPSTEMPHFFIHADAMLISLKKEDIFSMTIPSKLQAYMAASKPVMSMLDGIANDVIRKSECGFIANAGDYHSLVNNVIEASNLPKGKLQEKAQNGKLYYDLIFEKNMIVDKLCDCIDQ